MVILNSYTELDFRNDTPGLSSSALEIFSLMSWTLSSILFCESFREDAKAVAF